MVLAGGYVALFMVGCLGFLDRLGCLGRYLGRLHSICLLGRLCLVV